MENKFLYIIICIVIIGLVMIIIIKNFNEKSNAKINYS
jgi:hypothetical protein